MGLPRQSRSTLPSAITPGVGLGCSVWMRLMPANSPSVSLRSRLARLLSSCSSLVVPMMLLVTNGRLVT